MVLAWEEPRPRGKAPLTYFLEKVWRPLGPHPQTSQRNRNTVGPGCEGEWRSREALRDPRGVPWGTLMRISCLKVLNIALHRGRGVD